MKKFLFILMASLFIGCVPNSSSIAIKINKKDNAVSPSNILSANVSSIQIINNQLVINGNGFADVINVKVDGTSFSESFSVESKTATKIIANSIRAFSFDVSKVFNVILSDANASATFPIDFSLCNATLNGKGFSCSAPVADKDVLSYDAVSGTWKPRAVSGLNYLGAFNASSNPATGPAIEPAGAYYIISADGTIASIPFSTGDWLVSNGSSWQKIDNSTAVLSVFGRNGAVTAQTGDYNLDMLGDISFPTAPVAGKVLKFDGTNWVAGDDLSGGGAGSVGTTEIADGSVTDAKIVTLAASKLTGTISSAQITDATIVNADISAGAAIDYSKLSVPDGSIPYAKLNIADGEIPAAKISGLPSATTVLSTSITDGDTTHAPDGNIVFDTFATKLDKTGGTITSMLNVPAPVLNTEATTKLYVDTADNLKANKAGDTFSGVLTLDNDLLIKGGSNYVTIKGNAASAAYTLTLPINAGTSNQVLTTNGSGVLSWTTPAGGGAPSGAAGGDLSGTYPNPTISGLSAAKVGGGAVDNTEFSYLDGVTSAIQTQLNGKEASLPTGGTALQYFAGNKTLQTLNTAAVPESSNLYFTQARAIASSLTGVSSTAGTITAADTILSAFGKVVNTQGDYVSKSANSTVLSQLTVSGTGSIIVPTPTLLTHAANMGYVQSYVDTYGQWVKNGANIYRPSGNVGIGIANPGSALSVNGVIESLSGGIRFPDGSVQLTAATSPPPPVQWNNGGGSVQGMTVGAGIYSPQGQLGTKFTTPTTGSVDDGYYTFTLPYPVNFNGTNYSTIFVSTNSYVTFGGGSTAYSGLSAANPAFEKIMVNSADRSSNSIWFDSTPTSFSIRYEGGCGTSPGTTLVWELRGTSANDKQLSLQVISLCSGGFSTVATTNAVLQSYTPADTTAYLIDSTQIITPANVNYTAGNVGIGLTTPDEKFVVSNGTTIGKYTTGGWTHSSDARLKHDISPIEDALNKVLRIKGVEYKFNSDPENKTQLGFIAQEVEPVFPEVVQTDKKGYKSMIYSNLIAPLVESVKALYARIVGVEKHNQVQDRQIASKADKSETELLRVKSNKLELENAKLKKENEVIKARLEKIEKALNLK